MRVLITGATGLVGTQVVKALHQNDVAINYLTTSKDKIESSDNYQGYFWNPSQGEINTDCFKDVKAIINLAGASVGKPWTSAHKKHLWTAA